MECRVGQILAGQSHEVLLAVTQMGRILETIRHPPRFGDSREELGHRGADPRDETVPVLGIRVNGSHFQLHVLQQR